MKYIYFLLLTYQVCNKLRPGCPDLFNSMKYVYFLLLTYQVCNKLRPGCPDLFNSMKYVYFLLLTYQVCNKLRSGCPDLFNSMKYVYFLFICYLITDQPQSQEQATYSSAISVNYTKFMSLERPTKKLGMKLEDTSVDVDSRQLTIIKLFKIS